MASIGDIARDRTDLGEAAIAHLQALASEWTLLADLGFADLVLWLPTWNDGGFVAAAQVRPTTVGAFAACMQGLLSVHGERIIDRRLVAGRPILGICVDMQILFSAGVEHGVRTRGLGQWPGVVEPLDAPVLPHMGWNTVTPAASSVLFEGVEDERFYFVHSYAVRTWNFVQATTSIAAPKVTWAEYGAPFIAAVENGPLSATQFHPEKSGDAGARLLRNWVNSVRTA